MSVYKRQKTLHYAETGSSVTPNSLFTPFWMQNILWAGISYDCVHLKAPYAVGAMKSSLTPKPVFLPLKEVANVVSTTVQTDFCQPSFGDCIASPWTIADGDWGLDLICMKGAGRPPPVDLVAAGQGVAALKDSHHPYLSKQKEMQCRTLLIQLNAKPAIFTT